jgi:LPPG:FO 2-phospho-L-lactate transferase
MSDQAVRTLVHTDEGDLPFQHYFVRRRCEPVVMDMTYVGAPEAKLTDALFAALDAADVIVFCPSNPYLSLDPILSIPGLRRQLRASAAPKVAVSPIVGGRAIKVPAAKLMRELGVEISPISVIQHFDGLLDGFVLDEVDAHLCDEIELPVLATNTIMSDLASKTQLAQQVLEFAVQLRSAQPTPAPVQHRTTRRTQ